MWFITRSWANKWIRRYKYLSQQPDDLSPVPRNQRQKEVLIPENYLLTSEHTCVPTPTFISNIYPRTTIIISIYFNTPFVISDIHSQDGKKKQPPVRICHSPSETQRLANPIPHHSLTLGTLGSQKDHTFIIDAAIGILLPRQQLLHLCLAHLLPWGCGNGVVMTRGKEKGRKRQKHSKGLKSALDLKNG